MAWGRRKPAALKPDELARAWRRSMRAAVQRDWAAAETWLERIVESDSADLDAYHALARLYREQGAVGRAIRMHQNLLLRTDLPKKDRSEALFELARDFEDGGFTERAAATYEELLDQEPRNTEALTRVIPLLGEQREHARALALVKKLRRRDSETAQHLETNLLLGRSRNCLNEGDHDGARQALKRCLRRNKSCAPAWAMLGELETERGRSAKALDAWKRAAMADGEIARELYPKIDAGFAAKGKPAEFDRFLREVLSERPDDSFARIALARSLAGRGEGHTAIEEIARAIEVEPDAMTLRAELGRQLLAANQESEALKAYAELVEAIDRGPVEEEALV
jgi:lipopolysaccharide biosynthesis regulator YciM